MSGLTKTPLSMLESKGSPGSDVQFDGKSVVAVEEENVNNSGVLGGSFDDASGTLTLSLVNGETIQVSGFMTQGDIGVGDSGAQGISGVDGTDGLLGGDGEQGSTGCAGPAGTPGATGPGGAVGPQGNEGPVGPEGREGVAGIDGAVDVYIQTEDPGAVGPGALWVKP